MLYSNHIWSQEPSRSQTRFNAHAAIAYWSFNNPQETDRGNAAAPWALEPLGPWNQQRQVVIEPEEATTMAALFETAADEDTERPGCSPGTTRQVLQSFTHPTINK